MIHIDFDARGAGDRPGVHFLDAGGAPSDELVAAIGSAIESLSDDAVLTVFSSREDARAAVADLCDAERSSGLDLVAALPHAHGTTFVIRRNGADPGG